MCWCFESPASKFVSASLLRIVMQGFDTRVYTGSGGMSLCPIRTLVLLHSKFAVGVKNGREREWASQVSGECVCGWSIGRFWVPCVWGTPVPFIVQGEPGGPIQEGWKSKEEKLRGSDAFWSSSPLAGRPGYGPYSPISLVAIHLP